MTDIMVLDSSNYKEANAEGLVLIDYYSTYCAPCRKLLTILGELADNFDGKIKVAKVEAAINDTLAAEANVTSVPTLVLYKDGTEVERIHGAKSLSAITEILNKYV